MDLIVCICTRWPIWSRFNLQSWFFLPQVVDWLSGSGGSPKLATASYPLQTQTLLLLWPIINFDKNIHLLFWSDKGSADSGFQNGAVRLSEKNCTILNCVTDKNCHKEKMDRNNMKWVNNDRRNSEEHWSNHRQMTSVAFLLNNISAKCSFYSVFLRVRAEDLDNLGLVLLWSPSPAITLGPSNIWIICVFALAADWWWWKRSVAFCISK